MRTVLGLISIFESVTFMTTARREKEGEGRRREEKGGGRRRAEVWRQC